MYLYGHGLLIVLHCILILTVSYPWYIVLGYSLLNRKRLQQHNNIKRLGTSSISHYLWFKHNHSQTWMNYEIRTNIIFFNILSWDILVKFACYVLFFFTTVVCRRVHVLFVLFVLLCIMASYTTWLYEKRGWYITSGRNCLTFASTWVHPGRCWGPCCSLF